MSTLRLAVVVGLLIVLTGNLFGAEASSGVFMTREDHARIQKLVKDKVEPFNSAYRSLIRRADAAWKESADPFWMEDVTQIKFGWCSGSSGVDDTLKELTGKLERQSDWIRSLALVYSLSGKKVYAKKAEKLLLAWVEGSTLLNLYDLDIDFEATKFKDSTDTGYCGERPWNMALDTMWQGYGLINVSDAYVLLKEGGYDFGEEDNVRIRSWIRELTEAVNSSFHAWTRWADLHRGSSSFTRYRADNHLSWCLASLLAASVALEDEELAAYVLSGGSWEDSKAGNYENPSSIRDLINLAIEADVGGENHGRIYEEKIRRKPPVGYSYFHLWPMALVASIAEKHYGEDLWNEKGEDGVGLEDAFSRYADYALGKWDSPKQDQEGSRASYSWLFELAVNVWPERENLREARDSRKRDKFMIQSIGPVALLYGAGE